MTVAIQWLVRNFELRTIIARIVQIAGKVSVLKIFADIKDKKHSLINTVVCHYDIEISVEDLIPENFNSAEAIYALVQRLKDEE